MNDLELVKAAAELYGRLRAADKYRAESACLNEAIATVERIAKHFLGE